MKIGVIGANGQVGREVCLFLHVMGVHVIPISRTTLGGAFLDRCGLRCRYGAMASGDDARRLLDGCDLVADFAIPRAGLPAETRPTMRANIRNAARFAPPRVPYVYMSSVSALGMPRSDSKIRRYWLAHTRYVSDKRYCERIAKAETGRDMFIFRLGQVHGELQRVSRYMVESLAHGQVSLGVKKDAPSYTVFCFTIAEALHNVVLCMEKAGTYTLVSTPPWSWAEVFRYWSERSGVGLDLIHEPPRNFRGSTLVPSATPLRTVLVRRRDLLMNYLLQRRLRVLERAEALYLLAKARAEVNEACADAHRTWEVWRGTMPGRRLNSLSDSRTTMQKFAEEVSKLAAGAVY